MITRATIVERLADYLAHRLTLADLVDWAEGIMMEEEFDLQKLDTLRNIVSRLRLADVRAFGLTWEDCESFLRDFGYHVHVEVTAA